MSGQKAKNSKQLKQKAYMANTNWKTKKNFKYI